MQEVRSDMNIATAGAKDYEYINGNVLGGQAKGSADTASAFLSLNADSFIKILVAQLKNQDPTEPMDSLDMTKEITNFTVAEQTVAVNKTLQSIETMFRANQIDSSASLIGKEIMYDVSKGEKIDNSPVSFAYTLEPGEGEEIAETVINILNERGAIIKTLEGAKTAGLHDITWDGTMQDGKKKANDGKYKISVRSVGKNGNDIVVGSPKLKGKVNSATLNNDEVYINIETPKKDGTIYKRTMPKNQIISISGEAVNKQALVMEQVKQMLNEIKTEE